MMSKRRSANNQKAEALLAEIMPQLEDWISTQWTARLRGYDCTVGRTIAFVIAATEIVGRARSVKTLLAAIRSQLANRHLVEAFADAARTYANAVARGYDSDQQYRHNEATVTYSPDRHQIVVHSRKAGLSIEPSRRGERAFSDADGALVARIYQEAIRRETGEDAIVARLVVVDHSGHRVTPADGRGPPAPSDFDAAYGSLYALIVEGADLLLANEGHATTPGWSRFLTRSIVEAVPLARLRVEASNLGREIAHLRDAVPHGHRLAAEVVRGARARIDSVGGPAVLRDIRIWVQDNNDMKAEIAVASHVGTYNPRTLGWMDQAVTFRLSTGNDIDAMIDDSYGAIADEAAATWRRTGRPPIDIDVDDPDLTPYRIERPVAAYMQSMGMDVAREATNLIATGSPQRRIAGAVLHLKDGVIGGSFQLGPGVHWRRGHLRLEGLDLPESAALSLIGESVELVVRHDQLSPEMKVTRTNTRRLASGTITKVHLSSVRCLIRQDPKDEADEDWTKEGKSR